jgi:methylated-DNA-[protein]-cysteine S-methyltransferase
VTLGYDLIEMPVDGEAGKRFLLAVSGDGALRELWFAANAAAARAAAPEGADHRPALAPLPAVRRELAEYFAGKRRTFTLPLAPQGTDFERSVWDALVAIPYGETRSYAEIARTIGRPDACRAVGRANGRNPIPIVIPCHRVIGSDGSLTGYGGGLDLKRFLLGLEGVPTAAPTTAREQLALPL